MSTSEICSPPHTIQKRKQSQGVINDLDYVNSVPSNVQFSHQEALLYVFVDNEAVIKMIFKGTSPTMRHVSRTHRVALDWLFDRINLDPKIQIKNVDTKHQLADILTNGKFTRDEWNNLLHLFNISHFSLLCCSQNFSLTSCTKTMAKRMQEQAGDNRIVAKSKPTTMNLAFTVSTSSSTVQNPVASNSPGILKEKIGQVEGNLTQENSIETQRRVLKDGINALLDVGTSKLVATEEDQEHLNYPDDSASTRKLAASGNSEIEVGDKVWTHNLHFSTNYILHMKKVFSILRKRYGLSPTDQMKGFNVNTAVGCIFMSVTFQAAVHLGKDYTENLRSSKKRNLWDSDWEVDHGSHINYWTDNDWLAAACVERDDCAYWQSCSVCNCQNIRLFWRSAMSGGISTEPVKALESKIKSFLETRYLKDLDRIDREQMVFGWTNFQGFTTLQILDDI